MAIMILALVAGVFGFELKSLMAVHRFQHNTKRVKEHIERAQLLALIYSADMQVIIKKEKGKWVLSTHSDEAVLQHLNKKQVSLEGIDTISWRGSKKQPTIIDIFSSGRLDPLAVLEIKTGDRVSYIDCQVPIQINLSKHYKAAPKITIPKKPEG